MNAVVVAVSWEGGGQKGKEKCHSIRDALLEAVYWKGCGTFRCVNVCLIPGGAKQEILSNDAVPYRITTLRATITKLPYPNGSALRILSA